MVDSQFRLAPVAAKNRERYTDARTNHAAASIVIAARLREMFTQHLPRKLPRGGCRGALRVDPIREQFFTKKNKAAMAFGISLASRGGFATLGKEHPLGLIPMALS